MKIKNFSKSKLSFSLPSLLSLQRESWEQFWQTSLRELFEEMFPIQDYTKKHFELDIKDFQLGKSKYKDGLEARKNNDSYEAPLRVRAVLKNLKTKDIKEQEVFLADFPLMTDKGTFIINGVERVTISQLIRSPGVFFTAKPYQGRNIFGAKVIPTRGAWLEFETETSGFIAVRINRERKIAATTLLRVFGLSEDKDIIKTFQKVDKGDIEYIEKTLKRDNSHNAAEAAVEIYKKLRPGDLAGPDAAQELIFNMFCNFQRYDISRVGRWKMRERLEELRKKGKNDEIKKSERVLTKEDLIAVIKEIIRLNNNPQAKPDQIDHLGNRRVRSLYEILQDRMRVGLMRMERIIKDRMSTLETIDLIPSRLINQRPLMAVIQEFFGSSQLSQFMDNENPLSELEHKRRITATGPGGLTRERAGFEVRDVQASHYGRICPIQTPEGQNVGLIGHLACFARVNPFGFLETPYFKVDKGKITKNSQYLSASEEEKYNITHAGVLMDKQNNIIEKEVEARTVEGPRMISRKDVDFIDVSSKQPISVATSLIPFLQNDDANRALMGSNMQRQAVPLVFPEAPLVGTGVERNVARDSGEEVVAEDNGLVTEVDANQVKVKYKNRERIYNLRRFVRGNQYTCFHQRPVVKRGQKVKKGDILVDGTAMDKGRLALGRNILVAFLPLRGGNYEDAICLSERLVKEDAFTSIHIEDFNCDVRETKLGPEITTCDIPNVGEDKLKDLDAEGIVRIGAEVKPGDILVGKISPKGEAGLTAEERLLRAIFGEKAKDVKDSSLKMEHGKQGRVISVKVFSRDNGDKLEPGVLKRIRVEIAQLRKVKVGDKLCGRHGNKGVISKILPEEEMPFLEDGTPIDIVLDPMGVVSRMNIGQILETHLGLAAKKLNYLAISPALLGANEEDIKRELKTAGLPESGQLTVYDGRTGEPFPKKITVGYMYIMKLIHMVEDKIHMRSIGPYSLITQQPLGGKAQFGGQRFGEMEVWSLEGYGVAHILQEMLTIKSDDIQGRAAAYESILKGEPIRSPHLPASFNLLALEMKSLGISIEVKASLVDDYEDKNKESSEKK
jgi:DNA-directed RNA polymerase subunit beta